MNSNTFIPLLTTRKVCIALGVFFTLSFNQLVYSAPINSTNTQKIQQQGESALLEKLALYKGQVIYLDFWASWCVPCRKSFPWMNAMQEKYKKDGFVVVAVNLDAEHEEAQRFLEKNTAVFDVVYDPKGETPKKYGVKGMPTSYLIGRDGKVKIAHTGFFSKKKPQYESEIQSLLNNKKDPNE
jgi:thiol-disulfide isomerase/thioredoxin